MALPRLLRPNRRRPFVAKHGRPRPPDNLVRTYVGTLRHFVDEYHALILPVILRGWERNPVAFSGRVDAIQSTFTRKALQGVDVILEEKFNPQDLDGSLETLAAGINRHGLLEFRRLAGVSLTRDPQIGPMLTGFRQRNVDLIKSIQREELDKVRDILSEAEAGAWRAEDLSDRLEEEFGVTRSRADLIARDQVLKLNGQITQARQTSAGIEEYIWMTSNDERVRDSHAELEGTRQRWDTPPEPGHPGDDYQCRCTAYPVVVLDDD